MLVSRRPAQADYPDCERDWRDRRRAPRREARGHRWARSLCRLPSKRGREHSAPFRGAAPLQSRAEARSPFLRSWRGLANGAEKNPGQPVSKSCGWLFAFHHPCLVEEEPNNILESLLVRRANFRGQGANQRMTGVDFEHWFRGGAEPAARREHPFEPPVGPAIGCNEASRARGQPIGGADILDRFAQDLFHERIKRRKTGRRRLGRSLLCFFLHWDGFYIGSALRHRFERLAVEADRRRDPKSIDRIRQKQNLDSPCPEPFELRAGRQMRQIPH